MYSLIEVMGRNAGSMALNTAVVWTANKAISPRKLQYC